MNKTIHYFWFGYKPKPRIFKKCLKSWKKYLSDWDIVEWNESNLDISISPYVEYAYNNKKWAFVSDYFRCYVLEKYGGLYLDIDVELLGNVSSLLNDVPFLGFEPTGVINPGLIMYFPNKHHPFLKEMIHQLDNTLNYNESTFTYSIVIRFTEFFKKHGLIRTDNTQFIEGIKLYPCDYFCPASATWKYQKFTENTVAIHHFYASWFPKKVRIEFMIKRMIFKIIHPINYFRYLNIKFLKKK